MLAAWVGWAIFALLIVLYTLVVVVLYRSGRIAPDKSLSLLGPLLMTKTKRGLGLLDRLGRFKRWWSASADLGLVLAGIAMVVIVAVLCFEAVFVLGIGAARAPTPSEAIGLPGINPFIPIGYGIIAIVIGIVIHEMFHGIVARSQKIGVKSVGILWLIVPIGAFVEQDDVEMMAASRRARDRVGAAGILANFVVALVAFLVLSVVVSSSIHAVAPGVGIVLVESGTPASTLGLQPGDILTQLNGTAMTTTAAFENLLAASHPNQTMAVTWWSPSVGHFMSGSVQLAVYPGDKTRGYLGVEPSYVAPSGLITTMATPWASTSGPFIGFLTWVVLPVASASPIAGPSASFFQATGPLAGLGLGNVLILINFLYWLTWMNLLLGASNALPMIPLDGNLLFRDWVAGIVTRVRKGWTAAQVDDFSARMTVASTFFVVFLLLWQFVGPRL